MRAALFRNRNGRNAVFRRDKFVAISNQVEIEGVYITHRSRHALAAEISTRQKYPEILGYSEVEMHIWASERTLPGTYDKEAQPSTIIYPPALHGAELAWALGRYTIYITLFRKNRCSRRDASIRRSDEWREAYLRKARDFA